MDEALREYFREIGRRGGRRSRRELSSETARSMVRVREARRAFRKFYAECFWSCSPEYRIGVNDVGWVAECLRRHGGREAWEAAARLCR